MEEAIKAPSMSVTIRSKKDSQEISLSKPSTSSTYEAGGRAGVSVFKFEIEEPGTYRDLYSHCPLLQWG